jgi:outer membrane protein assembly factor BamB
MVKRPWAAAACLLLLAAASHADDLQPPTRWNVATGLGVRWFVEVPQVSIHGGAACDSNSRPTLAGDRLFVLAEPWRLYCLDAASGKILWHRDVPPENGMAPRIDVAIAERFGFTTPTPVTDGKRVWCVFGHGVVACFDRDGQLVWRAPFAVPSEPLSGVVHSPVLAGKRLLTPGDSATSWIEWDADSGQRLGTPNRAEEPAAQTRRSVSDGMTTFRPLDDRLEVLEQRTGKLLAELPLPGNSWSQPTLAGRFLFCFGGGARGRVVIYDRASLKLEGDFPHGFEGRADLWEQDRLFPHTPVFAGERMYIRDARGVWCIDASLVPGSLDPRIEAILATVPQASRVRPQDLKPPGVRPPNDPVTEATTRLLELVRDTPSLRDGVLAALRAIEANDLRLLDLLAPSLLQPPGFSSRAAAEHVVLNIVRGKPEARAQVLERFEKSTGESRRPWAAAYCLGLPQPELATFAAKLSEAADPPMHDIALEALVMNGVYTQKIDPTRSSAADNERTLAWLKALNTLQLQRKSLIKPPPVPGFLTHPDPDIAALSADIVLGQGELYPNEDVNIGSERKAIVALARGGRARAARQTIRILANLPAPLELGSLLDADAPLMVRYEAAEALSRLGAAAAPALPALDAAAGSSDPLISYAARRAAENVRRQTRRLEKPATGS